MTIGGMRRLLCEPRTWVPEARFRNPKSEIRNLDSRIPNPESRTENGGPRPPFSVPRALRRRAGIAVMSAVVGVGLVPRRAQFRGVEVVDADGVDGHLAQFFQLLALL